MGHRVANHVSKCRNPHGHRYRMIVEIAGEIIQTEGASNQHMVIDFTDLKKMVDESIIDRFDHSFVYWVKDTIMTKFAADNDDLRLYALDFIPTAESLVKYFAEELISIFQNYSPSLKLRSITLYETPRSYAVWQNTKA
jgi:6-pyruvoyltetrahydropterin/6-carboxytetrahydropterin synthase